MPDEVNLDTREKAFTRWINALLADKGLLVPPGTLAKAFTQDSSLFCSFVEAATKRVMFRWKQDAKSMADISQSAPSTSPPL